jgi:ankyrin repeat protein
LASQLGKLGSFTEEFVNLYPNKDLVLKNELDQTPFHIASKFGNLPMIETLLQRDHKTEEVFLINNVDLDSNTPLHLATLNKQVTIVRLLLSQGSDPKALNSIGWTSISCAAKSGDFESLIAILESSSSVDIDATDNNNTTPLHLAAREGHCEILDYLLEKGADVSVKDYKDRNPLEIAIEKSQK